MSRWLVVAVLALLVLTSAVGLRSVVTHSTWANTSSPVPPTPWLTANTSSPVPPTPWMNTSSPVPPTPWQK